MITFAKINSNFPKTFGSIFFVIFLTVSSIGILDCKNPIMQRHMGVMGQKDSSIMTNCVPGKNYGMDVATHVSIWQSMFTSLDFKIFQLLNAVVLLVIVGMWIMLSYGYRTKTFISYLYYKRHTLESKLYNYFLHIFARGILHPKLYT